jgi:phosphoglycerate dehydrogenase-like enzyme
MRLRIVAAVYDPPVWVLPTREIQRIAAALPEADVIDAREPEIRRRELPRADILLVTKLTMEEARLATRLKWIQSTAVGVGPVLRPDIVNRDVVVTNARGLHARFIAEHAIALTLALRRSLPISLERMRERIWAQTEIEAIPCPPTDESRMLVIGMGEIGSRIARMAVGLGFIVHAIRRRPQLGGPAGVAHVAGIDALPDELRHADIVVLAAPTTSETRTTIGLAELALMKRESIPRQCGSRAPRGRSGFDCRARQAANRRCRARCVRPGAIAARAPVWSMPNVIISPHSAAFGRDYWRPAVDLFLDNFRRYVRGEPLLNVVDKSMATEPHASDEVGALPPTIARLPFFVSGRFPKADLLGRCEGDRIVPTSGRELIERVRDIGLGLQDLGMEPGHRVALLSESRPDWLFVDFAVLASGAVTVPIYPTLATDQVAYILRDSEATMVVVSTAVQLSKVIGSEAALPALKVVIATQLTESELTAAKGAATSLRVMTLAEVAERGNQVIRQGWGLAKAFQDKARQVRPGDLATVIYTSGTTGEPKGVMLTHANLAPPNLAGLTARFDVTEAIRPLSFLPLCHGFERIVAYSYLSQGVSMIFAESIDTIGRNLQMVRPTLMSGVPRVYEKLRAKVTATATGRGGAKKAIFEWASRLAEKRGADSFRRAAACSPWLAMQSALADRLVYRQIRDGVGGRLRFAFSGSAPLGETLGRWFVGMGIPIFEGYGLTETSPALTVNPWAGCESARVGLPAGRRAEDRG